MKIDFEVLRWRLLIIGFCILFFFIGATRYTCKKIKSFYHRKSESSCIYPPGSLGAQMYESNNRGKK